MRRCFALITNPTSFYVCFVGSCGRVCARTYAYNDWWSQGNSKMRSSWPQVLAGPHTIQLRCLLLPFEYHSSSSSLVGAITGFCFTSLSQLITPMNHWCGRQKERKVNSLITERLKCFIPNVNTTISIAVIYAKILTSSKIDARERKRFYFSSRWLTWNYQRLVWSNGMYISHVCWPFSSVRSSAAWNVIQISRSHNKLFTKILECNKCFHYFDLFDGRGVRRKCSILILHQI